ncbi:MAG TPA: glutathione S-transferase C-terminal domain-containing protein [Spongiibacteraceae bacterium]|nr:glutathione S-transferase C-terminal domain-containing protein [Spongiibacteraceae bacterium]
MTAVSVLYGNNVDPHSQRARLALTTAGVHCELREVDAAALPPAVARLPLLQLPNGKLIDDSFAIAHWACARRPELDLWPDIRVRQQSIENLVRIIDGPFAAALNGYRRATGARPQLIEGRDAQGWRFEAEIFLAQLEARLARMSYLVGDHETLADIAVLPFIQQFADLDRTWFDVSPYRQLRAWLMRYRDNANWQQASRPVTRWQAGAQPIYLIPANIRRASA